jgi:GH15 family glucan-1,4-alpha-glucosidase
MYNNISDYGIIGNMHTICLVSNKGSIDYCCLPRINSPAIFAALLDDEKAAFVTCNFWLIECLTKIGELDEAKNLMQTTLKAANHLGLFSEEYDPAENIMLGNFPQAYSHIGFINAAAAITQEKRGHSTL